MGPLSWRREPCLDNPVDLLHADDGQLPRADVRVSLQLGMRRIRLRQSHASRGVLHDMRVNGLFVLQVSRCVLCRCSLVITVGRIRKPDRGIHSRGFNTCDAVVHLRPEGRAKK